MTFEYRLQIGANWQTAKGFVVQQFESVIAQLLPIQPLLALGTPYPKSSALVTDTLGNPRWSQPQPTPLQIPPAATLVATLDPSLIYQNWIPPTWDAVSALVLTLPAAITIASLAPPGTLTGVFKLVVNASLVQNTLTLLHQAQGVAGGTPFRCPNNDHYHLTAGSAVQLWYDVANRVWQVVGN